MFSWWSDCEVGGEPDDNESVDDARSARCVFREKFVVEWNTSDGWDDGGNDGNDVLMVVTESLAKVTVSECVRDEVADVSGSLDEADERSGDVMPKDRDCPSPRGAAEKGWGRLTEEIAWERVSDPTSEDSGGSTELSKTASVTDSSVASVSYDLVACVEPSGRISVLAGARDWPEDDDNWEEENAGKGGGGRGDGRCGDIDDKDIDGDGDDKEEEDNDDISLVDDDIDDDNEFWI